MQEVKVGNEWEFADLKIKTFFRFIFVKSSLKFDSSFV